MAIKAPESLFAAQLEELQSATLRRDHDRVRELLFTAGLASAFEITEDEHGARQVMNVEFDWADLGEAEPDREVQGALSNGIGHSTGVGHPESDSDQVSA